MQIIVYNGTLPPVVYDRVSKYQHVLDIAEVLPMGNWVQVIKESGDPKSVLGYVARLAHKAGFIAHQRRNYLFVRNHVNENPGP